MRLILIALLLVLSQTNNITGNLPTIVTQMKNYTSASPKWVTSPFFRAGNQQVIKTYTGSSQFPFAAYTFTYSSPLPGVPNLAYGIQRYRGNDYLGQEFWEIRQTGLTATTFAVQIQIFVRFSESPICGFWQALIIQVSLLYILVMIFVETKTLAEYVQYDSMLYPLMAYIQYGCYAFGAVVSYVGLGYHIVKRVKGKKIQNQYEPNQTKPLKSPEHRIEVQPQRFDSKNITNQSKQKVPQLRKPVVFDLQQINEDSVNQTTLISLDSRSSLPRRRRNKRWQ